MGVVYRAEDTALGRTVALKFLSPQIAQDPKRVQRFRDEARTASSLNHPNICTIYEVGEEDGELFIAMEFVEGRPLAEFLRENGMAVETVLRYARQICAALEHAHEHGIVHRDLKPVNVVVTPNSEAKILDFGLAKRTDSQELQRKTTEGAVTETSVGLTGTLPYMSPEQLEGKETTARSDIWSLGVMLYEMSSGKRPFGGENLYRLCTAIIQEPAPPLPEHVPAGLAAVIRRCLEKEPARRYQRASEVRAALEALEPAGTLAEGLGARAEAPRRSLLWVALTLLVVLIGGVGIGLSWRNFKRAKNPASGAIAVPERVQLAILPASSATGSEETAFDDGLVETLTSRLTQLTEKHPLAVIPASEVRARKVTTVDAARAEFGVNLGLLISVQHAAGQERVNYSLVDAHSHQELRGGTITAATSDPFALQDRVSESVAQALELQLQPQEKRALQAHGTTEPAAYDFYLQGRGYLQDYGQLEKIDSAVTVFGRALEKDPAFAAAYAGLGEAYWRKYELAHETEWVNKAAAACQQATQRDDGLAEGHACLGLVYQGTGKYEQASQEYGKAAAIEPTLDAAQSGLAGAYERLNRTEDAEKAYRAAIALRPNYWAGYNRLGALYLRHGKMENAAKMFSQVVSLAPDSFIGYSNLGIVRVTEGRYQEAIPLLERSLAIRETGDAKSNLATAYFQGKRYAEAAKLYEEAASLDPKNYELWGNLGDAYYWAPGVRESAPQAYRKAVQLAEAKRKVNARDANLLSYLASYYAMLGSRKQAEERIAEALRLAPRDAEVLFYSAVVHKQFGETNKALDALERSIAAGYSRETIRDTPNFSELQDNPRFHRLLSNANVKEGKNP
jgi:tetratricopeptide (TPR) repeat protein/tRNA A-37 threonylcarbamoyl transferase component Bud32